MASEPNSQESTVYSTPQYNSSTAHPTDAVNKEKLKMEIIQAIAALIRMGYTFEDARNIFERELSHRLAESGNSPK